jgi:hypothetical protein
MPSEALFTVTGPVTAHNAVPAEVLVRAVQALQQAIWLIAAAKEDRTVRHRFVPDQAFRQRLTLELAVPVSGSYALPLQLVDCRPQIATAPPGQDFLAELSAVWSAVANDDLARARSQVGDNGYFLRVMQEFHRMLPKRGDRWALSLGCGNATPVELTARHRTQVGTWLRSPSTQREMAVVGDLLRIDFPQKRVWILYPPTSREIECSYLEDVEDSILDGRRGQFQVIGQFVLDADGRPLRLTDVRSIEPVDLSPVEFREVEFDDQVLHFEPAIILTPRLDDDEQQYFVADIPEFGLTLGGRTRDELLQDWEDQIQFVWREYVLAQEDTLAADALALRTRLLTQVKSEARSDHS